MRLALRPPKITAAALAAAFVLGCAGCGGTGANRPATASPSDTVFRAQGSAVFTVTWPAAAATRLIPAAANSIKVRVTDSAENHLYGEATLARPSGGGTVSATFERLPVGDAIVTATAYPNTDGTGVAQAQARVSATIIQAQMTPVNMTMASTIDHIDLTPGTATLNVGQGITLTATARDASGNAVLTAPTTWQWTTSTAAATVNANGVVNGVAAGTATISVQETESGKSASRVITVAAPGSSFVINGVTYVTSGPEETLTATFTKADGGITVTPYKGYVLLRVSGVGQAYSSVFNDAFYLYTGPFGTPQNGHDGGFYQLTFGTSTLPVSSVSRNAKNFLVGGGLPAYNASHEYTVFLNTSLLNPGLLHFGVSDGGYADNTGAYSIKITQLIPAP